jgi:hypothetical protein
MPSYFIACTTNGIIVSSHRLSEEIVDYSPRSRRIFIPGTRLPVQVSNTRIVTFNNGIQRVVSSHPEEVKLGFFSCRDPKELKYEIGEELPVRITDIKTGTGYFPERYQICWATPDEE